jgi:hypothetical protein
MAKAKKTPTPKFTPGESFDPEAIQGIVGDQFTCQPNKRGNVQVLIKNLATHNDYTKCKLLVTAADALHKAGIIIDPAELENAECPVSLSWNTGKVDEDNNPIYRPYPKLWANQPTKEDKVSRSASEAIELGQQNAENINKMGTALDQILARLTGPKQLPASSSASSDSDELPFE